MTSLGEPIAGGQAKGARDELSVRFESGIDLERIRSLLQEAHERVSGATAESAFTLNLVAVYFSRAAYERAKAALEAAGRLHPCRQIVLVAEARAEPESVLARVSAVRSGGATSLERVVLLASGKAVRHLESAMLGLLLPELPLVVVWGGRAEGALFQRAVESADRVIIDSGTRPPEALAGVAKLLAQGAPIGDLAWARIFPWQALAADVLDLPNLREHRGNIQRANVSCAGGVGAEAMLLAGWLASRLKEAKVELLVGAEAEANPPTPGGGDGSAVGPLYATAPLGEGQICAFELAAPPARFCFSRAKGILLAEVQGDDDGLVVQRVRLPPETPGRLLALELKLLSGQDELYAQSVQAGIRLFSALPPKPRAEGAARGAR